MLGKIFKKHVNGLNSLAIILSFGKSFVFKSTKKIEGSQFFFENLKYDMKLKKTNLNKKEYAQNNL